MRSRARQDSGGFRRGGSDAAARILADKMKDTPGVPVVVENKAGAGGQIAAQALKNAPADGNTPVSFARPHDFHPAAGGEEPGV